MTQFKPGDRVTHNPTGEEWILVAVYGSYVKPGGWRLHALASDCTLICTCTGPVRYARTGSDTRTGTGGKRFWNADAADQYAKWGDYIPY